MTRWKEWEKELLRKYYNRFGADFCHTILPHRHALSCQKHARLIGAGQPGRGRKPYEVPTPEDIAEAKAYVAIHSIEVTTLSATQAAKPKPKASGIEREARPAFVPIVGRPALESALAQLRQLDLKRDAIAGQRAKLIREISIIRAQTSIHVRRVGCLA